MALTDYRSKCTDINTQYLQDCNLAIEIIIMVIYKERTLLCTIKSNIRLAIYILTL